MGVVSRGDDTNADDRVIDDDDEAFGDPPAAHEPVEGDGDELVDDELDDQLDEPEPVDDQPRVEEPADLLRPIEPDPASTDEPRVAEEPDPAATTAANSGRPRRGGIEIHDRRRLAYGIATAAVLVVAGVFGLQLVRALAGDEASATATEPVAGPVGALVPHVVAFATPPAGANAPEVLAALTAGRHDVAVDTTVGALCATVETAEPVTAAGRWERDGHEVASTTASALRAPGFADCIDAGGDPMPDGVYQFVVTDEAGATSAPGTIVLGASVVSQSFVNETDEPVCGLRLAPLRAGYFELFDATAAPIAPGAAATVPLADVRQTFEAVACDDGSTVASAQLRPDAGAVRAIRP